MENIETLLKIGTIIVTLTAQFIYLKSGLTKQSEEIIELKNQQKNIFSQEKHLVKLETELNAYKENSKNSISTLEISFKDLEKWVELKFDSLEKKIEENHIQLLNKFEDILKMKN